MMISKKYLLLILIISSGIFLSACGSVYESTGWHGLATDSGITFLTAGRQVYSIDLNTGSEDWHYPEKADNKKTFYSNPVMTPDGQLLVASYDSNLYSINPATGSENWVFENSTNRLIGSPLVTDDLIFQPSSDHSIYALDFNGRPAWKKETAGPLWAQPATSPDCGCIYVASMDHTVYSFDAASGRQLWQSDELGGAMVGTPAVSSDGVIYIGTFGNEMLALDGTDGRVLWRFGTEDWVWAGPALADDILYFGDLSGYFYAVNATDGTLLWRIQPQNAIVSTPVVLEDVIYLTTEGDSLYIINKSGDITDRTVVGGTIYGAPLASGDTLLVSPINFDSLLVALNMDGNQKWTFTPAE